MYNDYFGFKEAPFSIAPDPRYLYMTAQHREALAHLVYGLNAEGGCILLTGEVGTGKTTICRCLLEQIPEQANVALLLNPKVSEIELLETLCDELKIDYPKSDNSVKTYTDRIYEYLITGHRKNEKTVLIIDEAQNLDSKVLEQLRLLTNLETDQRKLLQIIILGQPELLDILAKKEMRQLAQRITARFHLQPLSHGEVKAYVNHRLAVAGQNIQLFPEKSIKLLYRLSNGVPRLINIICDRALLGSYVENQYNVSPAIIKKAATEVFGELKNVETHNNKRQWLYPLSAVTLIFIIGLLSLFLYFDDNNESMVSDTSPSSITVATSDTGHKQLITEDTDETETDVFNTTEQTVVTDTPEPHVNNNIYSEQHDTDPAVVSTAADHGNIDIILNDDNVNPASAYQALFRIWQIEYNKNTLVTACRQAEKSSLSCLHKQGNLNSLKAHNRPAVLTLLDDHGTLRHVTISAIDEDIATVYSNNTAYKVKLHDLDKYWYGNFIILWRKPENYASAITPGDTGNIINWLNIQLSKINKRSVPEKTVVTYNDSLVNRIKEFQADNGLSADGIVGPMTIIQMNSLADTNVPSLVSNNMSEGMPSNKSEQTQLLTRKG